MPNLGDPLRRTALLSVLGVVLAVIGWACLISGGGVRAALGRIVATNAMQTPYDPSRPQVFFMAEQTASIWLLAFWPGMTPYFAEGQKAQSGQEEVSRAVSILLTDVTRWKNNISAVFEIDGKRWALKPGPVPDAMRALAPSAAYIGSSALGTTIYPIDAATFLVSGEMDSFPRCDAVGTPHRRPTCEYWFEDGPNRFQVSFARRYADDLRQIRQRVIALRDLLLHPDDRRDAP